VVSAVSAIVIDGKEAARKKREEAVSGTAIPAAKTGSDD
jgi:hypothetical protein